MAYVTAADDSEDLAAASVFVLRSDGADFLNKPVDFEKLVKKINGMLEAASLSKRQS